MNLPAYVERDGDWVLRPPGVLQQVSIWVLVFPAGTAELNALCSKYVNTPSGGVVTAAPLSANVPFVLLVCADITHGTSADPTDQARGWMTERDVGFFVPVTVTSGGNTSIANLIPYLYVNSMPGMLMGRELFGFPKLLGTISLTGQATTGGPPMSFTVTSPGLPATSKTGAVVDTTVISVRSLGPNVGVPVQPGPISALQAFVDAILEALGLEPPEGGPLASIPQLFLKQFRDATTPNAACIQQLIHLDANITSFGGGSILLDPAAFALSLPSLQGIDIAGTLGLKAIAGTYTPVAAVSAVIEFTIPYGTVLWP